jgi:hypothetical protein
MDHSPVSAKFNIILSFIAIVTATEKEKPMPLGEHGF